jgi:hypothetical protein
MHALQAHDVCIFIDWSLSQLAMFISSLVSLRPSCRMQPHSRVCDEIYPFMCRVKSNIQAKERRLMLSSHSARTLSVPARISHSGWKRISQKTINK